MSRRRALQRQCGNKLADIHCRGLRSNGRCKCSDNPFLSQDEIDELGISQAALAEHLGVLPKTINEICRGKRGISAEMAMKLSQALGASPQFWLILQNNWDLSQIQVVNIKRIAA